MHWRRRLLLLEMVLRRRVHAWVQGVAGGRVRGGWRRQIPAVIVRVVLAVVVVTVLRRRVMPVGVRVRLVIVGSTAGKTALHIEAAAAAAVDVIAVRVAAAVGTSRRQRARLLVGGPTARSRRVVGRSPRPGPARAAALAPPAARAPTARHTLGPGAAAAEGFFVSLLPKAALFLFRKTTKRGPT